MKLRRDFLLAFIILFAIPVVGYFVLKRAESDRMKISASLQPKDSIALEYRIKFLTDEGRVDSGLLTNMPYILMVVATNEVLLDQKQVEDILYIINDRDDFAFLLHDSRLKLYDQNRIRSFKQVGGEDNLSKHGDILLVDTFNRILQKYERDDPELFKNLLEDISYALPMVGYRIEKLKENAEQEPK